MRRIFLIVSISLSCEAFCENLLPMPPVNRWSVNMVENNVHLYPDIPAFRTSNDGRVAMAHAAHSGKFNFYLFVPENVQGSTFIESANGVSGILPRKYPYAYLTEAEKFHGSTVAGKTIFQTLCDGTSHQVGNTGVRRNPYVCKNPVNNTMTSDCYDLDVITAYGEGFGGGGDYAEAIEFWGAKIFVRVDYPKTIDAKIGTITVGAKTRGKRFAGLKAFFEPMITEDGKLLVGRIAHSNMTWTNNKTGLQQSGIYETVYSYSKSASVCDVTGFKTLAPITHIPHDPDLKIGDRPLYEIARYPFRDPEGNTIPDGNELGGTYPWIDRKGRNLFVETVSSTLFHQPNFTGPVTSRYPAEPWTSTPFHGDTHGDAVEQGSNTRGISVIGGWTHGKLVLLDSIINNIDYGIGAGESDQRWIKLYRSNDNSACLINPGNPACVRVGAGRETSSADMPAGTSSNINIVDSFENIFNYIPAFTPASPRDVVWIMNTGRGSAEVAFDDYLDPHVFIYSDMNASLKRVMKYNPPYGVNIPEFEHNDGWNESTGNFSKEIHLQNAATSPDWAIPAYGKMVGTGGRIEPVAMGGFQGKGLWMRTTMGVEYAISAQPQSVDGVWFYSLFVDLRDAVGSTRVSQLLTFPDGSSIDIVGRSKVRLVAPNRTVLKEYPFPADYQNRNSGWAHLGFRIANTSFARVRFFYNGIPTEPNYFDYPAARMFRLLPGKLVLGQYTSGTTVREGMYGWIDEFRAMAYEVDSETFCNIAGGTLLTPDPEAQWVNRTCVHNYVKPSYQGHFVPVSMPKIKDLVATGAMLSLRNRVHTRDKDLFWDQPRPDFSTQSFCLSCHTTTLNGPMGVGALAQNNNLKLYEDRRRQPGHPMGLMFGMPLPILPPGLQTDPANGGWLMDQWVFKD